MSEDVQSESEVEHTLFIVEADDLDDAAPYQVTMLEHPPDSAQATAVEEAMRQLVETAEEETGERHRLVTEVDTPEITEANYEVHTELLEYEELATDGGRDLAVVREREPQRSLTEFGELVTDGGRVQDTEAMDRFPKDEVLPIAREIVKLADQLEERDVPANAVVMAMAVAHDVKATEHGAPTLVSETNRSVLEDE